MMEDKADKTTLRITLQGKLITDIAAFYAQINQELMQGEETWQIASSLDAFNDLLYGQIGKFKHYDHLEIYWQDIDVSKQHLGLKTTLAYYRSKIYPSSPFNQELFERKIEDLKNGVGETYFDILMDIISSHKHTVKLICA